MKKDVYFLHTFGRAYWPQKSFYSSISEMMGKIDYFIRHEFLESSSQDAQDAIDNGFHILKIDTERCKNYKDLFLVKKPNKFANRKKKTPKRAAQA